MQTMQQLYRRCEMEIGDGNRRVTVSLNWNQVQALLNSAVAESDRVRRQGKRLGAAHLVEWADFALNTANELEQSWLDAARRDQQRIPKDPNYRYEAP